MTASALDPALETALDELFAAPFPDFVDERKRLVVGLRAAGHKAAATALGKVNRPTLASWAINQLVRRAPSEVSAMFATAARVRLGDFAASAEHRGVIARLSALATEILRERDLPTTESTLRRITTSLQALSAYGDFAPDLPGRMIGDRDPPGFDAMALESSAAGAIPLTLPAATIAPPAKPAPSLSIVPAAAPSSAAPPRPQPSASAAATPTAPVKETAATIKARIAAKFAEREASASSSTLLAQLAASASLPEDKAAAAAALAAAAPHLRIVPAPAEARAPAPPASSASALDQADAEAAAEAEAAERAVAEAAAALAAAQAAAKAAAARVHLARQKAVLEDLRTRQRRAASSIYDHEQAIALMQRELEQRQALLATARRDAEALQAELEKLTAELAALEPPAPKPS